MTEILFAYLEKNNQSHNILKAMERIGDGYCAVVLSLDESPKA